MKRILIATNILTLFALGYLLYKKLHKKPPIFVKQSCSYSFEDIVPLFSKNNDSSTIIMLGDSRIKQGNWTQLLNSKSITNLGINGDKAYCICKRLDIINKTKAKICFIEGGVMDLYTETPDSIVQSFKNIVSFCKQQNIVPVINCIVKINSKASPYFKEANLKIDTSNKILIAFAKAQNIDYIDLNQFVVKDNLLSDEYTTDGSHFNAKAYNIWANEISPILVKYNVK